MSQRWREVARGEKRSGIWNEENENEYYDFRGLKEVKRVRVGRSRGTQMTCLEE